MRNRHAGTCYRCGLRVEVGEGHFERVTAKRRAALNLARTVKWIVQHADCALAHRGTPPVQQQAKTQ